MNFKRVILQVFNECFNTFSNRAPIGLELSFNKMSSIRLQQVFKMHQALVQQNTHTISHIFKNVASKYSSPKFCSKFSQYFKSTTTIITRIIQEVSKTTLQLSYSCDSKSNAKVSQRSSKRCLIGCSQGMPNCQPLSSTNSDHFAILCE